MNPKDNKTTSVEQVTERGRGGLRRSFLFMTLVPIVLMGIVFLTVGTTLYSRALQKEVQSGLHDVATCVEVYYDRVFPGEYNVLIDEEKNVAYLKKGGDIISTETQFVEQIAKQTDIEITIIFYDTRMISTIEDKNGNSIAGTKVNSRITDAVYSDSGDHFFDGVEINGIRYCANYLPLINKDGTCVGMIGTAKPYSVVQGIVRNVQIVNAIVIILTLFVVAFWMIRYTSALTKTLDKLAQFLAEIAKGNMDGELNQDVLKREDEIGDIGRHSLFLKSSLKKLIEKDPLTNLNNRRSGNIKLDQIRARASKYGGKYAVAMGDIDFFKKVNDTYGHDAGDEVLKTAARILSDGMAGKGTVIRWGGEEFLFIFDDFEKEDAVKVLNDILARIRATVVNFRNQEIRFTMSYGVVQGDYERTANQDITEADELLYFAKSHGRNRVVSAISNEEMR